jgi:ABC-type glycerol-3-phosphate transport system substrate-binding protein
MKKRSLYIVAALLAGVLLGGCGNSTDSASASGVSMELNTTYEVYPGDKITADEESELVIDHQYGNEYKTVTLISGSAKLFK